MGEMFRRYWLPAALSPELPEPDGPPIRVRLLGEDLVAFRDSDGAVGLVDAFCPHRRAPMFFGRNEECGLRCVYHGWKFDRRRRLRRHAVGAAGLSVQNEGQHRRVSRRSKPAASCGPTWDRPNCSRRRRITNCCARPQRTGTFRRRSRTATGCRRWKAASTPRTSTSCTTRRSATARSCAISTRRSAHRGRTDRYGFRLYRHSRARRRELVRVYHYVMPVTQIRGQIRLRSGILTINGHFWVPVDDEHTATYNFMYSDDPAPAHHAGFAADVEREIGRGPEDSIRSAVPFKRKRCERFPDRPGRAEAHVHRHPRHQHARFRAASRHGTDRRPLARASRHDRPRDDRDAPAAARSDR